ncbi:MAG: hypothetical protein K6T29_08715 [Peptococcaceae bacterium]|nr:hypothetical protein [Peptococcaceae bacterium]
MFKGMPSIFWIGLAIMYGLAIIFWIFEIRLPGSVYDAKIGGVTAPFIYGNLFMLYLVNLFLAWLWYYVPEQAEKKQTLNQGQGGDHNVSQR